MVRTLTKRKPQVPDIRGTMDVWKAGTAYVAYAPELDISSCGDSVAEAKADLREAVTLFLEECSRKGDLDPILSESGFEKRDKSYRPRRILTRAKVRLEVPLAS
jgi:predicted RNase H-like HicB family nuclease